MRKTILSILGVLLIIGSVFIAKALIANKKQPKPVVGKTIKSVLLDTVFNTAIEITVPANGKLKALERIEVFSEVSGVFKKGNHLFKTGQVYKKGEVLVRIDASEYNASVQSAKSNLYNNIAAIMPDLRLDFPSVYDKWQDYLSSYDLSKRTPSLPAMSNEKENYFITGRGIVSSFYNVRNLEQRLAKFNIRAPFTGVLIETLATEGSLIRNGQKLGEFINPEIYEMEVSISKSLATFLTNGKKVVLTNLDKTEKYTGVVKRINASIDAATQTVSVFIEVKNNKLKEGLYLEAQLKAKTIENAIEINRSLLLESNEIFYVNNNKLDKASVIPVYFSEETVVVQGVKNGTAILKNPVLGAYKGMLVKPFQK